MQNECLYRISFNDLVVLREKPVAANQNPVITWGLSDVAQWPSTHPTLDWYVLGLVTDSFLGTVASVP